MSPPETEHHNARPVSLVKRSLALKLFVSRDLILELALLTNQQSGVNLSYQIGLAASQKASRTRIALFQWEKPEPVRQEKKRSYLKS